MPVTVRIEPNPVIACPGHRTEIRAVATPEGGVYVWSSPASLVNTLGQPDYSSSTVYLWDFMKNDTDGSIREKTVPVVVNYVYRGGMATASAQVLIHKIDFEVTGANIVTGVTAAHEEVLGVRLGPQGMPTISTRPNVRIKLDQRCPRKTDCAFNHKVGWLQTLTGSTRVRHYDHTRYNDGISLIPIRDYVSNTSLDYPFYAGDLVKRFLYQDGLDRVIAEHQDIPTFPARWEDPRTGRPELRRVVFIDSFTAWLAVQNVQWSERNFVGSFVFLKHFDWGVNLSIDVDWTKERGQRCRPQSRLPEPRHIVVRNGKGATDPNWGLQGPAVIQFFSRNEPIIEEFNAAPIGGAQNRP